MEQKLQLKSGDLIVQQSGENSWRAIRILEVDPWPDGTFTAHCLFYAHSTLKPDVDSLRYADIMVGHAPVDAASYATGWELVGNEPPSQDDLDGFITYLRETDFQRFLHFTGQDLDELIQRAKAIYVHAHALGREGKRDEAIDEYSRAIDLLPTFWQAIDNRAFLQMELGDFESALHGFEHSLSIHPDGVAAFFSKGECLMKLGGRLEEAEAVFAEGVARFPDKRALFVEFLETVRAMRGMGI